MAAQPRAFAYVGKENGTSASCSTVIRAVLFGTVNAGRRHWEQAAEALAVADPSWLSGLITRRSRPGPNRSAGSRRTSKSSWTSPGDCPQRDGVVGGPRAGA